MRHLPRSAWMIALATLCVLLACRAPWLPPESTTPSDTSAKKLDLQLNVLVIVDSHGSPQDLNVAAAFTYQKVPVKFQKGEQVVCDGIIIDSEIGSDVPLPKDGGPVVCSYDQGNSHTEISFSPPLDLIVSSPQPNAKLARSATTTLTFAPDDGRDVTDVNVNCADANYAHQTTQEANTNAASIQCDSSTFTPGDGVIHLQRDYVLHPKVGFHSLDLVLTVAAKIPVQWT